MKLHKEGIASILLSFLLLAAIVVGTAYLFPKYPIIYQILAVLAFGFWLFIISFFRYPVFEVQKNPMQIISPADGKVVVIEKTQVTEFLNEERIQISIFMSPTNTHMNRYPISGEIAYYKYHPGKHYVAWLPKSSTDNERSTVVIKNNKFSILVRQIAGAVARRVVCYSREGQQVEQGEQLGFIKFGSRVDLFLPLDADIKVNLEDKTRAGKTIIAEIKA
jgi:phosphatidylserine decarboxylase